VGENINPTKKNTEALLHASKQVAVDMNAEKTGYMLMPHH